MIYTGRGRWTGFDWALTGRWLGFDGWERVMREIIRTAEAPATPATYSQAVKAGGLVFVSGTSPHDPATGKIAGETIQEQTRQCLKNIAAILEEGDFAGMNEEWVKWFPTDPPARQGAKMPVRVPGMKVSIAVIAEGGE
jgi:2-iminobutanoate/2-iminopropanoate deaminase